MRDRPAVRGAHGALLPTPARRSRLPSSKFLGQAGSRTAPIVRAEGKSEGPSHLQLPGPSPEPTTGRSRIGELRVPGCRGD